MRLTGERAIDVADASGTLLFDVAQPALVGRGLRRARDPARVAAARRTSRPRSPAPATRRRPRSASASPRPGPVSVVLGTSGVVFAALPALRARPAGARPRLLPRRSRHLARDGRDAQRRRLAALAARRARRATSTTLDAEASGWAPGARACSSRRTSRASARRTPTRTRAARSPACRCATTAARSGARCSRASPTGCATRSSCCASSASQPRRRPRLGRRRAQRAVAADRRLGARPAARADASPRRARRSARRCSRACARASSPTRHEAVARCVRATRVVEPGLGLRASGYARLPLALPRRWTELRAPLDALAERAGRPSRSRPRASPARAASARSHVGNRPAERVGEAHDHAEERARPSPRRAAPARETPAAYAASASAGRQLVGPQRLLLDEAERRRAAPAGPARCASRPRPRPRPPHRARTTRPRRGSPVRRDTG